MAAVITCKSVSFSYHSTQALDNFNLTVNQGEIMALLGPNGAGKTTAIRVMNGLLMPQNGRAEVLGFDPGVHGDRIRARAGVLTETPALYERLTAFQNLAFFGALYGLSSSAVEARGKVLLDVFGLRQRAGDRVGTFSKGMKQRLALARALLHDPELIFLDEPTSGLDPEAAKQVQELIYELGGSGRRTVVLCTHRLYEVEKLCHRVAVMKNGSVAAAGSLDELRAEVLPAIQVIIRLNNDPDVKALDALSRLPDVQAVIPEPDGVITLNTHSEDQIPAMVNFLVNAGAQIRAVEPHRASLEEIYLKLQETHEVKIP